MAFGPKRCACCGSSDGVEAYHLHDPVDGGSDELTIWLCADCHSRTNELKSRTNTILKRQTALDVLRFRQTSLSVTWIKASESNRKLATAFAANVLPIIHQLKRSNVTGYQAIAAALNTMGVKIARGGKWQSTTVGSMLRRKVL